MKRYFQAPISTGPAKSGGPAVEKPIKEKRDKRVEGETVQQGKDRRAGNKARRKQQRQEKSGYKYDQAQKALDKVNDGSTNASLEKMNKAAGKAERLAKKFLRQEGRAERKKIRSVSKHSRFPFAKEQSYADFISGKDAEMGYMSSKEAIKKTRKDQKLTADDVKKYIKSPQ